LGKLQSQNLKNYPQKYLHFYLLFFCSSLQTLLAELRLLASMLGHPQENFIEAAQTF